VTGTRAVVASLDGFARATDAVEGVYLRDLQPMTHLLVETCNSEYRIVIAAGSAVLVEGGRFFERPTEAVLEGASLGGSFLKVGWIGVGLRMEIRDERRRIVTSPVRKIATQDRSAPGIH
jgi:hypothetical protein